jgi:hypothetical protein
MLTEVQRRARIAVTATFITNGLVVGAFVARIPDIKAALEISNSTLSLCLLASALGVNPFFLDEYLGAAKLYSASDLERVFNQIKLLDLRLKGVHRGSASDGELLIEAIVGILRAPQRV